MTDSKIQIVTNNKPRPILSYWELTDKQKNIVDREYNGLEDIEVNSFVFYKKRPYLFDDFTRVNNNPWCNLPPSSPIITGGWHAYLSDTFFSAILIKICADNETCIIGSYYA